MMTTPSLQRARHARAFTLVELLVASVVLMIILLMLVAMVNQTSTIWRTSSAKVEQFRAARTAFETINRHLSQATLNTYFDYSRDTNTGVVQKYIRQSDLRFVVGSSTDIVPRSAGDKPAVPGAGHAVFFHAPLGYTSSDYETIDPTVTGQKNMYSEMDNLLNTWGYFIEYSSDYNYRPPFLNTSNSQFQSPPERHRYRLMEFMVPSDQITIYKYTSVKDNATYSTREWFDAFLRLEPNAASGSSTTAMTKQSRPAHLLAENILTLVIYPQLSPKDRDAAATSSGSGDLAPGYTYDSAQQAQPINNRVDPRAQLPPIVQLTMVAMDETSAARQEATKSGSSTDEPPPILDVTLRKYFQTAGISSPQGRNTINSYAADLKGLQSDLVDQRVTYRTFTTTVSLRAAKWSQD